MEDSGFPVSTARIADLAFARSTSLAMSEDFAVVRSIIEEPPSSRKNPPLGASAREKRKNASRGCGGFCLGSPLPPMKSRGCGIFS